MDARRTNTPPLPPPPIGTPSVGSSAGAGRTLGHEVVQEPPTVFERYPGDYFPESRCCAYTGANSYRAEDETKKLIDIEQSQIYSSYRRAAEAHRLVRDYIRKIARPGCLLIDLCETLEQQIKRVIHHDGVDAGIAFPPSFSVNRIVSNWCPNHGDTTKLKDDDVVKLNFATHFKGFIVDSGFTMTFDPKYDKLVKASKDALEAGIKTAGIDVPLCEIGEAIEEVLESYEEVEINGKSFRVKSIKDLFGHKMAPYKYDTGVYVPTTKGGSKKRMVEDGVYTIASYVSTGRGKAPICTEYECTQYMVNPHRPKTAKPAVKVLQSAKSKELWKNINQNFPKLGFCTRWLGNENYTPALKHINSKELIKRFAPTWDSKGSYVSYTEHTILLRPTCKEVLSKGDDY